MAKKLSEKQKEEIIKYFIDGITIVQLSEKFNYSKATITRNLKKELGEKQYKDLINKYKLRSSSLVEEKTNILKGTDIFFDKENDYEYLIDTKPKDETEKDVIEKEENVFSMNSFMEITPLNLEFENAPQKDLSSIPISEVNFPNVVYMIVDKKIELEIKLLKDYPEWQFLSQRELNRKTIEIFFDLKIAKTLCNKEQKVIKVPNTEVLKIVAPILLSRGISRIVSSDRLIAL